MGFHDISEDCSELLGALLEAMLYGFSLLMFVATMWVLLSQRSQGQVNRKMFAVACALLLFSTAHLVINVIRVAAGFVLYRDTYANGTTGFFLNLSQWTWVWRSYVYTAQTLIGDGVILYRCYMAWQSKLIMVLPLLLWCSVVVTGFVCPYMLSHAAGKAIYSGSIWKWIISFYASTLTTNLFTTSLLVYRIWSVDKKTISRHGRGRSRLRPVLKVILDAGVIYSLTLVVALICFSTRSNGQFVVLNMITPIISITFYMVIIRVGMANRTIQPTVMTPRSWPLSPGRTPNQSRGMEVHISTLSESKCDGYQMHQSPATSAVTVQNSCDSSALDHIRYVGMTL